MHALLQWNNCIYSAAYCNEILSGNNESKRNENIFIRTFRSPLVAQNFDSSKQRLWVNKAALTSTHNLWFAAKLRNKFTPETPVLLYKSGI